jgi:probable DNA repair protein
MMRERSSAAKERSTMVVATSLAARQWELYLSAAEIRGRREAWDSPALVTYANWLESLWLEGAGTPPVPLTPAQSLAVWRRIIAESSHGTLLIGQAGVATWAAGAWELLHRWRIDPEAERAGGTELDYGALLGWCRSYRGVLRDHGWVDRAELEGRLAARPARTSGRIVATDLEDPYPARTALLDHLGAAGLTIEHHSVPPVIGRQQAVRLADSTAELRAAVAWAERRLEQTPDARIAIVVAGLAGRGAEVERLLAARFGTGGVAPAWSSGHSLAADPSIGAALTALALLAPATPYATFGRWLRSPFFAAPPGEASARAMLDAELRSELRSQPPFLTAYRHCGLAGVLRQRAPHAAAGLAAAYAEIGAMKRATPSRWAHLWTRFLANLNWQPPLASATLLGWQAGLDDLARLTAILGELPIDAALQEFERILERPAPAALPLRGVHVLGHIDDVGPGYDAVWVTGFTDSFWPEAPQGNPLLPRALQRLHGMPRSSPQAARSAATRSFDRILHRVPELVVSWPARVYDYDTEPSPAIRAWPPLDAHELGVSAAAERRQDSAARETVADPAPAMSQTRLPGGAGMLGRQARCPLRAFCQDRLRARALEPLGFGVPARLRGIAAHRAAELLLASLPTQAELTGIGTAALKATVHQALAVIFDQTRRPLAALFALEEERLQTLLGALVTRETERAPFRVLAVEQRRDIQLGRFTLQLRLDRLDRLADGSVAVIDYKTGDNATSAGWFAPRLRDAQVPLYAIQSPDPVGAAVIARLGPAATSYVGLWQDAAFPGRPTRSASAEWGEQLELWRAQLEELAAEFASGDTRVFSDDYEDADAAYAPLTRIHEQLGLARGSVARW